MRLCGLRPAIPAALVLTGMASLLAAGCFRSPHLSQITCTNTSNCPSGYTCVFPNRPGGCMKTDDGGTGDGSWADRVPSLEVMNAADGLEAWDAFARLDGRIDGNPTSEAGPPPDSTAAVPEIDAGLPNPDGATDFPRLAIDAPVLDDAGTDTPVDHPSPDAQPDARSDHSQDLAPDHPQTPPDTGGSSGSGGNSSGGTTGAGGITGGTIGSGGTSGDTSASAGSTATNSSLSCTDAVYGAVSIPAAAVISDFENNSLMPYRSEGRAQGTVEGWRGWADADAHSPENSPNILAVDPSVHGPCSSKGALHISSTGPATQNAYAAFGLDVMGRTADMKKQSWDASKYTGVGFWAKCSSDLPFAFLKVVDGNSEGDMPNATCSYAGTPKCVHHGVKNAVITKDWTYYKLFFNEILQDPNGGAYTPQAFAPKKLVAFQVHVSPFIPRTGALRANKFDCYVDDVHFLSEPTPATPSATVSWAISGTKIQRNGKDHRIRGLVRPSMEWDYSGLGITREDAQRTRLWNANTVRLAVKDTVWNGASTGSAVGNGAAYQLHVKRAANWYLQQGMDVILDLHYVGGSPSSAHASFWDAISKDPFFQDGRIIYELFSEPTDGIDNLRNWGNGVIAKIRANGAKNLILMGGPDWSYDLSGYVTSGVTDSLHATAYAVHPYIFKPNPDSWKDYCSKLPVVATEFGDANVDSHKIDPGQCVASIYDNYISAFETIGMGWTSAAWIVDEWGCGFPQLIQDWGGAPNAIGKPVQDSLKALNP